MGKTSITSRFNIPGKIGWATMEAPGFINLLYIMYSLPRQEGIETLPLPNYIMAAMFVCRFHCPVHFNKLTFVFSQTIHYLYRALLAPLFLNPSMSPIHISVWLAALAFQLINSTCIGGWLAGHGPTQQTDWEGSVERIEVGMMIFAVGLLANAYHDDELREIRRAASRNSKGKQPVAGEKNADKVYMVPENGLFKVVLYPHYFCEWIEWSGFWMVGGLACVPARSFVINEIFAMLPRAVQGKSWYMERFGKKSIAGRKAVIPGIC